MFSTLSNRRKLLNKRSLNFHITISIHFYINQGIAVNLFSSTFSKKNLIYKYVCKPIRQSRVDLPQNFFGNSSVCSVLIMSFLLLNLYFMIKISPSYEVNSFLQKMRRAWRNLKNISSRPIFTIILGQKWYFQ